jgi:DEAD/DEAH box helicase domain-containing protein
MIPLASSTINIVNQLLGTDCGLTVCYDPSMQPATDGVFDSFPPRLHPELVKYLARLYPRGLFRHQSAAVHHVLAGRHTVVATRTSSGKSLIYLMPAFNRLLTEPSSTALFLFPQKALANDQLKKFTTAADEIHSLAGQRAGNPYLIARYDGATPEGLKPAIRQGVQVLLTNPDMLHYAILAWHEKHWGRFLSRLSFVVVDECHEYRGIFGTNVSYLFRRLRALCSRNGSAPTFIATSATVQSPQEHMERLTGLPFVCVGPGEDGSSQGERKFWMVKPQEHPHDAGRKLTLALADAGLTVLTFSPSRTAAERMIARSGRDNKESEPPFVRVYRAGLTASEREEIEAGLRDRTVRAVFSTSALELGIDIGAIDVVVCVGLPTTMMSLWQRAGRAGRSGKQGAIILIPGQTPIDAYHSANPDRLFARDHEPLVLNLCNQRVLHQHYACAAKEAGDEARLDFATLGPEISAVKAQRDAGVLREEVFYISDPHRSVRIRGIGDEAYTLVCDRDEIGEIDPFHLLREAPRNGIYSHGGLRYRVKDVLEKERRVVLAREFSPHFTTSTVRTSIRVRRLPLLSQHGRIVVARATLDVNDYLLAVTEKHLSGDLIRSYAGAGMPNNWLPTEGTMLRLERPLWEESLARLGDSSAKAALETTARLFGSLFPTVTGPCDASDYSAAADIPKDGPPAVYLYDMVPYGVGLAVEAFDRIFDLVERAAEQVRSCSCGDDEGCFQCVRNPQAEVPASKAATIALLEMIGRELAILPVVTCTATGNAPAPLVGNCPTCQWPLQPAARFCSNCGAKLEATP